jgi:ribosomal protein S18 acetylase RimI-like enzyme
MKMKDIASVYHIGNSIFVASEYPTLFRTWDDFAVVENYEISSEFCFVAESDDNDDENEIIGFLLGETVTKARVGTRGYIQWVAVLPPYRRMGIASALIDRFVKVAASENISLLLADTPADNDPAISMFEKAGLCYKTDHVYLTCQLRDIERKYVDEDMSVNFSYTAKKNRIVIRNMEIEDLYPIHGIGEEIFTKRSANLYNFWDEHLVLQSYLSDPEFSIVATVKEEEKEKVVGFAFGTTIEKPRSSWKYGYLVWLGCAKEYQGIGLASQLYTVMLELFSLEKVRMVMIDTQQNNEGGKLK